MPLSKRNRSSDSIQPPEQATISLGNSESDVLRAPQSQRAAGSTPRPREDTNVAVAAAAAADTHSIISEEGSGSFSPDASGPGGERRSVGRISIEKVRKAESPLVSNVDSQMSGTDVADGRMQSHRLAVDNVVDSLIKNTVVARQRTQNRH